MGQIEGGSLKYHSDIAVKRERLVILEEINRIASVNGGVLTQPTQDKVQINVEIQIGQSLDSHFDGYNHLLIYFCYFPVYVSKKNNLPTWANFAHWRETRRKAKEQLADANKRITIRTKRK